MERPQGYRHLPMGPSRRPVGGRRRAAVRYHRHTLAAGPGPSQGPSRRAIPRPAESRPPDDRVSNLRRPRPSKPGPSLHQSRGDSATTGPLIIERAKGSMSTTRGEGIHRRHGRACGAPRSLRPMRTGGGGGRRRCASFPSRISSPGAAMTPPSNSPRKLKRSRGADLQGVFLHSGPGSQ